jgi:pimeloyl-ACP methyl ester carboxylesterase
MSHLAYHRTGAGEPLVLLHALGLTRQTWNPVLPALSEHFDVIAVDLPGFGDSEPLPKAIEPTPAALAAAVAGLLDELGIANPHLVGNSLGGWVALEFASMRPAASVTLLSPAGLWRADTPRYCRASLWASRWLTRHAAVPLSRLVDHRLGRALVLGQSHGRPFALRPDAARAAIRSMGTSPGFDSVLKATATRRFLATTPIEAPVTVAFGSRDLLLLRHQSRHLDQLPPSTQLEILPGCGHVPMADDPAAVAALIMKSASVVRRGSVQEATAVEPGSALSYSLPRRIAGRGASDHRARTGMKPQVARSRSPRSTRLRSRRHSL